MVASIVSHPDHKSTQIETARLILRCAKADDASALHEAFKDPEVMTYWSSLPHENEQKTKEWVSKMTESSQNGQTDFIICYKYGMKPIGKIGVWQDQEIGFLLARAYWGKGLATEALNGVLPYLFGEFEMTEITADTDPRNAASIGLLRKLGFEEAGFKSRTFEIGGHWVDSLYLKLSKDKWQAMK